MRAWNTNIYGYFLKLKTKLRYSLLILGLKQPIKNKIVKINQLINE